MSTPGAEAVRAAIIEALVAVVALRRANMYPNDDLEIPRSDKWSCKPRIIPVNTEKDADVLF